nr:MAG TPA: hypothetical protein [Caudoviricetes sp.]
MVKKKGGCKMFELMVLAPLWGPMVIFSVVWLIER